MAALPAASSTSFMIQAPCTLPKGLACSGSMSCRNTISLAEAGRAPVVTSFLASYGRHAPDIAADYAGNRLALLVLGSQS
jgi:hypothetical protein